MREGGSGSNSDIERSAPLGVKEAFAGGKIRERPGGKSNFDGKYLGSPTRSFVTESTGDERMLTRAIKVHTERDKRGVQEMFQAGENAEGKRGGRIEKMSL